VAKIIRYRNQKCFTEIQQIDRGFASRKSQVRVALRLCRKPAEQMNIPCPKVCRADDTHRLNSSDAH
jgi:hypothetical protein